MKRCAKCGRAYSDLVSTCSYCGSPLSGSTGTNSAPKPPVQQTYTPQAKPSTPPDRQNYTPPTQPVTPPVKPPLAPARPNPAPAKPTATGFSENVGNGVLGALLFGMGGAAVQALLLNMGKVSAIAGIVCFLLTMSGYKKFSGIGENPTKTALWVCAPISLGMLFLGTVAGYAVYVANYMSIGISEALSMVFDNSTLTEAMGTDMATSVVLWGVVLVFSLIRGRKKK